MYSVRYAAMEDKDFWYTLDRHLPEAEFENKVRSRRGVCAAGQRTTCGAASL